MDNDGFISNGELFQVLKMMVGNNLKETQLQQIVDKTVLNADKDGDGKISFDEFCAVSMRFFFSVSCNFGELFVLCESDFSHPDHHHTRQTTDTPGLKPFTSFSEVPEFCNFPFLIQDSKSQITNNNLTSTLAKLEQLG